MNFSIPSKKITDGDLDKARLDLIDRSFENERATEQNRILRSAREAQELRGKTHPTLGRCVASIPARDYFRLVNEYGRDTVHSKEFLRFFNKRFKELSPNQA